MSILNQSPINHLYDELKDEHGNPRAISEVLLDRIEKLGSEELLKRQGSCEIAMRKMGVTFDFHDKKHSIIPFDMIPRLMALKEWEKTEKGLCQRIRALNLFLEDIYSEKKIIKDKVIPWDVIEDGGSYLKACENIRPSQGIYTHISGIDLVRHSDGIIYALEDNLRCPSGVSYVLKNRHLMKRVLPHVFKEMSVRPVDDYPMQLLSALRYLCPHSEKPNVVLLTPGHYNSAYYEHAFLAQQMGIALVEGGDLICQNDFVYMKTTQGLMKVDVIYRRVSDEFLDPLVFNPESMLGVKGIFKAYALGNVALANAPGAGVADDKVIYTYVPDMIKYYLSEEPLLENVPTYLPRKEKDLKYILDNMEKLVIKEALGSGGYGMLIGPTSSKSEIESFKEKVKAHPRAYIAQPTLSLSTVPTITNENSTIEGRHVDLRPFALMGEDIFVLPGGLTRVALEKGSLVVNSSQGGGTKDTWIVSNKSTSKLSATI